LYPDTTTYNLQLRDLKKYVRAHPDDAGAHFLLAYHFLVNDVRAPALKELRTAARLEPRDKLSVAIADALEQRR
jgi:hypothetical protein